MTLSAATYLETFSRLLTQVECTGPHEQPLPLEVAFTRAVAMLQARRAAGKRVYVIGNGGSDAIAAHLSMDLCNATKVRSQLFDSAPVVTALSNDHGYPTVFEKPLALFAEPGDLLIAISSSGQSENILRGARMATAKGAEVITFSGFKPANPLRLLGDLNMYVPSTSYGHVEMAHSVLAHFLTDALCLEPMPTPAAAEELA